MRNRPFLSQLTLFVFILLGLGKATLGADDPWSAPALSQDPKVLLKASEAFAPNTKAGTTILLNEMKFHFEQDGRLHQSAHTIYRIDNAEAVHVLSSVKAVWQPWHQLKPVIRARVITPDGEVHQLDDSALRDSPAFEQRPELFDDIRILGGPLPAVAVGALVEIEEVFEESQPAFSGGIVRSVQVGNIAPVENTRLEIESPSDVPLRYELLDLPNAHVERRVEGGHTHIVIVQSALNPTESIPLFTPGEVAVLPEVRFSSGESWKDVAAKYSAMVEPQIRVSEVESVVSETDVSTDDRDTRIRALVQKLHEQVRYTGVEFGISSYVPQTPSTVLSRHYGDCKDKAALLVAMLRAAKIPAYMALLTPGRTEDVRPTLPGFGSFTHAIVYAPGSPDRWIDATDEYAQADQLSVMDQGRLALVIREETTALTMTPISRSDENVSVDHREIVLEESGPAKGKESFEWQGFLEATFRRLCDLSNEKSLRQTFLSHVKREFGAEDFSDFSHGDARDLSKPLRLSLSLKKIPYATATSQSAVLWIQPPPVRGWLPAPLFHDFSGKDKAEKSEASAPRTIDFVLPAASVHEWRYRVLVPPGFELRSLPSDTTRQLGPALLQEKYRREADGAVLTSIRFEVPKQRLSPQEARDLVKAVEELEKQKAEGLFFDNKAYVLLASGKVREALAEYRGLIALHPKESLHHSELASALISVGLGEPARKEAEQATSLEPSSALAWASRGFVLEHDLIGRRHHKGFDRVGAIHAYEKAVSIDPKDARTHFSLAVLHEFDDEGLRYGSNAEFEAALKEYKAIAGLSAKPENSDEAEVFCLYYSGHFDEVLAKAAPLKRVRTLLSLRVAATAVTKNADAALELARSEAADMKERSATLMLASHFLTSQRRYREAATLESAGVEISEDPSLDSERLEAVQRTRPYEEILAPKTDPRSAVERLYLALYGKGKSAPVDVFSHIVIDGEDREEFTSALERRFGRGALPKGYEGLSNDVVLDFLLSNFHYSVEGNDAVGYRIRVRRGSGESTAFVVREDGDWKLLEFGHGIGPAGLAALAALSRDEVASARQWIDWGREEMEMRVSDDPLSGPVFPRIWQKGQSADRPTLETVAAVMVSGSRWSARSIPILQRAVANADSDEKRTDLQLALCSALVVDKQWQGLTTVGVNLVKTVSRSKTAFHYLATAYTNLAEWKDLERIAQDRLAQFPDDPTAIRDLSRAEFIRGETQSARDRLKPLIESSHPIADDLNEYAWTALFTKSDEFDAIDVAQRANSMTNRKNYAILHTLACLYADTGREREARQTLLAAMEAHHLLEPDDAIWFGLGRIAEEYGEKEAALAAYHRLNRPKEIELEPTSTWNLAQRRIRTLLQEEPHNARESPPAIQ